MGYFDQFQNNGIPFMEGAEKHNLSEIVGKPLHIDDFGFINTKDYGRCAVIHFKEFPDFFFFGNDIIREMLEKVDADGMRELLALSTITFKCQIARVSGREYIGYKVDEYKPAS